MTEEERVEYAAALIHSDPHLMTGTCVCGCDQCMQAGVCVCPDCANRVHDDEEAE